MVEFERAGMTERWLWGLFWRRLWSTRVAVEDKRHSFRKSESQKGRKSGVSKLGSHADRQTGRQ